MSFQDDRILTRIAIIGSGGHAKVITDAINKTYNIVGVYDDFKEQGEGVFDNGLSVIGKIDDITHYTEIDEYFIAVGDNFGRYNIYERLKDRGIKYATIIHPSAVIGKDVEISAGVFVAAGVVINPGTWIKEQSIINTSASIDHDNIIGKFSSIGPGVITGGYVNIGDKCAICMGAMIRNGANIFDNVIVGMGANVTGDILPNSMYYGNPAKRIKAAKFGDSYLHK